MRILPTLAGLTIVGVGLAAFGAGGSSAVPEPALVVQSASDSAVRMPAAAVVVSGIRAAAASQPASKHRYVFPVRGAGVSFHKTNAHAGYPATDIFAACGKPVVATTSGVVLEVSRVDRYVKGRADGPYNGGKFVSIRGDDGVRYYGSHLRKVQPGVKRGVRVKAGAVLGKVGHTGNASGVCHLHYGISPPCKKVGDWKVRRGVVWPAKYLSSWRKGGQKSPVAAVNKWQKKHHCRA